MKLRKALLALFGLVLLVGAVTPADAQYRRHRHRHHRHYHRGYRR